MVEVAEEDELAERNRNADGDDLNSLTQNDIDDENEDDNNNGNTTLHRASKMTNDR